jgi:cohesin complex subunit SA-1/2
LTLTIRRVFVNRYRDLDPAIRAECIHALGQWFKKHPSHFLDGAHLRYVGWVLSDAHTPVRLEAVRALAAVYEHEDYAGALQNFTERFTPRLAQMAAGDTDAGVRVAVAGVLAAVDGHGLLDDARREQLCTLLFDEEHRVRRAVAGFVRGVWQDTVDERLVGRRATPEERRRAGVKAFGTLLVRLSRALDRKAVGDTTDEEEDTDTAADGAAPAGVRDVLALGGVERGRVTVAVDALWDVLEPARDWEALLDVLLLDHSSPGPGAEGGRRAKGRKDADAGVDEAWRLEEVEETVLLEVLVAALRQAKALAKKVRPATLLDCLSEYG